MTYVVTIAVLIALVFAWVAVQTVARRYALRHPEFGPLREDGKEGCGGCGNHCAGHCSTDSHQP